MKKKDKIWSGEANANTNGDTGLILQTQRGKARDLTALLHGLRQEQVVAIHMDAGDHAKGANRDVAIHYYPHGGLDVKHKRKAIIAVNKGWATIYAFHHATGIRIFTGNAELTKIREDWEALGCLTTAMQQIKDRHHRPTTRLQLCGRAEYSMAQIGSNWFNLTQETVGRPGIIVIDLDMVSNTIYAFRLNRQGARAAIIQTDARSAVKITDTSLWTEIATAPQGTDGQFACAGRLIRAKDGTIAGDVLFTDNTKRTVMIKGSKAAFGEAESAHDEQVLSRIFYGTQPGIATQTIMDDGVEISFYPPTQISQTHRLYAEIVQNG